MSRHETTALSLCFASVVALGFLVFGFAGGCIWCYPVAAVLFLPVLIAFCNACCCYGRENRDHCCYEGPSEPAPRPAPKAKPIPQAKAKSKKQQASQEEDALPTPPPIVLKEVIISA
jgi:hypothetical protein